MAGPKLYPVSTFVDSSQAAAFTNVFSIELFLTLNCTVVYTHQTFSSNWLFSLLVTHLSPNPSPLNVLNDFLGADWRVLHLDLHTLPRFYLRDGHLGPHRSVAALVDEGGVLPLLGTVVPQNPPLFKL